MSPIENAKAKNNTYSIKKRLFFITCIIFLSFITIILICNAYFTSLLHRNSYNAIVDTLEIYNKQINEDLKALETYLFELNENNVDISMLKNVENKNTAINIIHIKTLLGNSLPSFTKADGLFVYSESNDIFIAKYKINQDYNNSLFIKGLFRNSDRGKALNNINAQKWFAEKIGDSYHLVRIMKSGSSYIGAWANAEKLTAPFKSLAGHEASVFYTNERGKPLVLNDADDNIYNPESLLNQYSIFKKNDGSKYVSTAVNLGYCPYYLVALIPIKSIDSQLTGLYTVLFILAFSIVLLTPTVIYLLNRLWSIPLARLRSIIDTLHTDYFDARISLENIRCREFMQVYNTFNEMIDEIQKLRINVYEEKIVRSEFELQYLKSQIAPHFLINCLSTISSLAGNNNKTIIIQDMITHLTNHLRYALSSQTYVRLEEELQFVENYILLAKLRAPDSVRYHLKVDREINDAAVFPMLLLMFTENTIKYNLIVGEMLEIEIQAKKIQSEAGIKIHLTHNDSGDGFSRNTMDMLAEIRKDQNHANREGHIGLYNIFKRLEILYGEQADIQLSNEPGKGARIDIAIPYRSYDEM